VHLVDRLRSTPLDSALPLVRELLLSGSWEDVAEATGLSVAAAQWRWRGSDSEIAARHEQGRVRSRTAKATDLPGMSVAEASEFLGVGQQAIYQQVARGTLRSETVTANGRTYKRVFPEAKPAKPSKVPDAPLPGLSVSEAAAARGVSSQAIYQLIARGKLEATFVERNGRRYKRVLESPVIAAGEVASADET
jgi:excisionase family DNA binding protein